MFRKIVDFAFPMSTARRAFLRRILGFERTAISSDSFRSPIRRAPSELRFTEHPRPSVSILIPVWNNLELTLGCLSAVAEAQCETEFEVLVGDDMSSDATHSTLKSIPGLRLFSREKNLGFLRNVNKLAIEARGDFLVILNNDTLVLDNWLEPLVRVLERNRSVGLAGPALLNLDGSLQDAGGIVYSDGTAANYGYGSDVNSPEVSYSRAVDYISGAALMVRRKDFLSGFGPFDDFFEPAYYEDTDLAMSARAKGFSAQFVPSSRVIHIGGGTHGVDVALGIKSFQEKNRLKFVEKWEPVLQNHHYPPGVVSLFRASRRLAGSNGTVVVVDDFPDWRFASGSLRCMSLLRALSERGLDVVFISTSAPRDPRVTAELSDMGVMVVHEGLNGIHLLREIVEDIALFVVCRMKNGHFVTEHFSDPEFSQIPLFFDTVDLHFLRLSREFELRGELTKRSLRAAKDVENSERALISIADATLVVSENEKELILKEQPSARVHVLSNVHPLREINPLPEATERAPALMFVANFSHPPNLPGILWFIQAVWPLIPTELGAQLRIVGANPPPALMTFESKNIRILGWIDDLRPLYEDTSAAVAPLKFGAGVKGKISEAWAFGVPVVGTSIAFEGMVPPGESHGGLVTDSPELMAKAIVELHQDSAFRQARLMEIQNFRKPFGEEQFGRSLDFILSEHLQQSHEDFGSQTA